MSVGNDAPVSSLRLVEPYVLECYWYEIFECGRKVALVGLPVYINQACLVQDVA